MVLHKINLEKSIECINLATQLKIKLAIAESCTGGLLSAYLTAVPGASAVFDRSFITYSNSAKQDLLNVSKSDIEKFGAVSREVASAMALGAFNNSLANIALSITGIAGPGGSTQKKPVGLIYIGIALTNKGVSSYKYQIAGKRQEICESTVSKALCLLQDILY